MAAEVPIADPLDLAVRLKGIADPPRIVAESAAPIAVWHRKTFWASNTDNDENFEVQAQLAFASPHVYFWIEEGVDYLAADVERVVDVFETKSYPTNREFFGSEWTPGVDGDVHLYVLFAGTWATASPATTRPPISTRPSCASTPTPTRCSTSTPTP